MDSDKCIICPKCGSKNIYVGKRGFSTGKAVVGGLLTGNVLISAAAGGIGANKIKLTCLDCGHEFNIGEGGKEPPHIDRAKMEEFQKHVIDRNEMPKNVTFKCSCGKTFSAPEGHPQCPKCGRRMNEQNIMTQEQLNAEYKSSGGCLGLILIPLLLMTSVFIFVLL